VLAAVVSNLFSSNSNFASLKDYKISIKIFFDKGIKGFNDLVVQFRNMPQIRAANSCLILS
jgi:hypothetical protein